MTPDFKQAQEARAIVEEYNKTFPPKIIDNIYFTDLGNARRLIELFGHDILYCYPWNAWLIWDMKKWSKDQTGEIDRKAKLTVRALHEGAAKEVSYEKQTDMEEHATKTEAEGKLIAMVRLARSEPGIPVMPERLDNNKWIINLQNGTLDLQKGELREHRRDDYITRISPIAFNKDAVCPIWLKFLDTIFQGDKALIQYIQKIAGRTLTGDASERHLYIFWGTGANGKSTLVETIAYILSDYAVSIGIDSLIAGSKKSIPNDIARLKGARFVFASEPDFGDHISEGKVKALTGKDTIQARFLQQEYFEFRPEYKIVISTNHKPIIKGADHGIWSRVKLIPFNVTIPDNEQDKELDIKLQAEAQGILNWMLEGCLLWQKEGMKTPAQVSEATEDYMEEMDTMADFFKKCCVIDPTEYVPNIHIYKIYTKWCEYAKCFRMTERSFTQAMLERGYPTKKVRGDRSKMGLKLTPYLAQVMKDMDDGKIGEDFLNQMDIGSVTVSDEGNVRFLAALQIIKVRWDKHNKPDTREDLDRLREVIIGTLTNEYEEMELKDMNEIINEYFKVRNW